MTCPTPTPPKTQSEPTHVRIVRGFEELVNAPLRDGVNAVCWERVLDGDFAEVARHLAAELSEDSGVTELSAAMLRALKLSPRGMLAVDALLEDEARLRALGVAPVLNCVFHYERAERVANIRRDVYSFHVDSAPQRTDTWLCTYHGAASELLSNAQAFRQVDEPATRSELWEHSGARTEPEFLAFLSEHFYDLHYAARAGAVPQSMGLFNLWRVAVEYPGAPVPACIHRAPDEASGAVPRLLLIA